MHALASPPSSRTRAGRRGLALVVSIVLGAGSAVAQVPRGLADLVMGASQRPVIEREVAGSRWHAMAIFGAAPYLLWPVAENAPELPEHELAAATRWLAAAGADLGHLDFAPRYTDDKVWRENEVWIFELSRAGIVLHDARVELHWREGRLVGLVNHVLLPMVAVEEPPAGAEHSNYAYLALPRAAGYAVSAVQVQTRRHGNLIATSIGPWTTMNPVQIPPPVAVTPEMWKEWVVPAGTSFPDQIDVTDTGDVWFSQPSQNYLTKFDPQTEVFTHRPSTGGSSPDGMTLDPFGRVWTGLYSGGGLGKLVISTGVHTAHAAPYSNANMAVPTFSTANTVWITDHNQWRVSVYDPATNTWPGSYVIPTPSSWPVQVAENPSTQTMYVTCYTVNKIAIKPPGLPFQETNSPSGGPAFLGWLDGKVYYSLWSASKLVAYDPQTGQHTSYNYPVANEPGGPVAITPDGRVVVGTRGNNGYVMVFDPSNQSFLAFRLPTAVFANMKDGITVGPQGEVWLTESSANKIARLLIP